ncbi:MAG: hypothetical protein IMZ61_00560, partial [Planctomycetes bacterium]|nr:hypothetical protein [Planctomycetota bacterium]
MLVNNAVVQPVDEIFSLLVDEKPGYRIKSGRKRVFNLQKIENIGNWQIQQFIADNGRNVGTTDPWDTKKNRYFVVFGFI